MKIAAQSHVGVVRNNNEDSYYADLLKERVFVVADGMGGHLAGEVASQMAVGIVSETINDQIDQIDLTSEDAIVKLMTESVKVANAEIYRKSKNSDELFGMGTTITMAVIIDGNVYIAHVGDSRAYFVRDHKILQATRDHTLVQELVNKGDITVEEAKVHPRRNMLMRAVGTDRNVTSDIYRIDNLEDNDTMLLVSDGLTTLVTDDEIRDIAMSLEVDELCTKLIDLANSRGGFDNITIVAVRFETAQVEGK